MVAASRLLPPPLAVLAVIGREAHSHALYFNLATTLARVAVAFTLAMLLGTIFGIWMGRSATFNRLGDPWLVILLNLPALVIIVLAYVWLGLTDVAAVLAVALNKFPNTVVTIREGARALDPGLEEMATVFAMPWQTRVKHVMLP